MRIIPLDFELLWREYIERVQVIHKTAFETTLDVHAVLELDYDVL